jgi:predicted lipid carrier protein YhbT
MNVRPPLHSGNRRRTAALPSPIRRLLRNMPRVPSSVVVAAALNLLVRRRLPASVLGHLGARPFAVEARDADLAMAFRFDGHRFVPVPTGAEPVMRFRVNASDFATLAAPDDAPADGFLHDLAVIGDPAIARQVHAALDGIDVRRSRRILRRAARWAGRCGSPR